MEDIVPETSAPGEPLLNTESKASLYPMIFHVLQFTAGPE